MMCCRSFVLGNEGDTMTDWKERAERAEAELRRSACEDARQDRALNDEMKRLWNTQPATPGAEGAV